MRRDNLDELLEMIDMESYLDREGVSYRVTHGSRGTQLNVRECPVCGNDNWKVYLNADSGLGNCFAGEHPPEQNFNKFAFIRAHLDESSRNTIEHIKQVALEFGWRPPKRAIKEVEIAHQALRLPESLPLPIKGRNLRYLEERRIDLETARYFHLRFCQKGVFWYQIDGRWKGQDYDGRIIIPVFDLDGRMVSFQGRDITGKSDRKYLFPPGFAATGRYLYNGHNARGARRIVVGEGAFDVMATKIALDEEMELRDVVPVGTFGKHLSFGDETGNDQVGQLLRLKSEGLEEVTFMWDGESSALAAACEAAERVNGLGLRARIARLPQGRDPNEVAPAVVREAFWRALPATRVNLIKLKIGK